MAEKRCSKCKEVKSLDDFGNNRSRHDGKQLWCKKCSNDYMKDNLINTAEYRNKKSMKILVSEYQLSRLKEIVDAKGTSRQKLMSNVVDKIIQNYDSPPKDQDPTNNKLCAEQEINELKVRVDQLSLELEIYKIALDKGQDYDTTRDQLLREAISNRDPFISMFK